MPVITNYDQTTEPGVSGPQPWGGFIYNKRGGPKTVVQSPPMSVQSPFYRNSAYNSLAAPAGDPAPPSAFNGAGYDNASAYIADLLGQINSQPQQTSRPLGWFELPQLSASLFGSAY